MADYHQIVDQIRAFLQLSDQTRNERLEGLASAYAENCVDVNQRLARCQRLLQQGLRSEAIQLAESEPRLVDAIQVLDFPERASWDELAAIYDLRVAPKLMVDAGVVLNEAYVQEEPLQDLLRTHRRLATQRAPLRLRIGVMRKLAAKDPNNAIWLDDLRTFEKARIKQIQVEAAEAVRLQDVAHINRLLAEVQERTWVEPPPKGLVQGLTKADAQLREQQAVAALADLGGRLNDAFNARDPARGRAVRQEWITRISSAPPNPGDSIWERVAPALAWLEEEARVAAAVEAHEASLTALTTALDAAGSIPHAELERLGEEVLRHGRGMPEKLQRRYATRLRAAESARTRRARTIAAGAGAVLLVAASLLFYFIRGFLRAGDAAQAAAAIVELLDAGDLNQAGSLLDNLEKADPGLLNEPSLIDVRDRYQKIRDQEKERLRKFEEAKSEAERAPSASTEPKSLETARALARLESEKQTIEQIAQRRQADFQSARAKSETALQPALDAISREIYQIGRRLEAVPLDQAAITDSLQTARRELEALEPDVGLAGEKLQSLAQVLRQKLDETSDRFDERLRQLTLLVKITEAATYSVADQPDRLDLFAAGLEDYLKSFPSQPCSHAFQKTLNERPLWDSVRAWNRLVSDWKNDRDGLAAAEARRRAMACGQFRAQHVNSPDSADIATYEKYAWGISRRAAGPDNPGKKLREVFSNVLIERVWMVTVKDSHKGEVGDRHYTFDQPTVKGEFVVFSSIINPDGKKLSRTLARDLVRSIDLSPQSKIADKFKPILADGFKQSTWETVMIDLVDAILRQPDIDPILQLVLLKRVVAAAVEGSEPLRLSLEALTNQLDRARVNVFINWIDPQTVQLAETQVEADRLIQAVRHTVPSAKQVLDVRDKIEQSVAKTYRPVGWLARDGAGIEVRTGVSIPREGDLLVVAPLPTGRGQWKKVGIITGGKPKIEVRNTSVLVEGRPVFVIMRTSL
jgi:hypothetical protein